MLNKKSEGNCCLTENKGKGRPPKVGESHFFAFRLRSETDHDEVLAVLDSLPDRAKSAWIVHALLCYVRGEIRDVAQETRAISEELGADLFSMFAEDDDEWPDPIH